MKRNVAVLLASASLVFSVSVLSGCAGPNGSGEAVDAASEGAAIANAPPPPPPAPPPPVMARPAPGMQMADQAMAPEAVAVTGQAAASPSRYMTVPPVVVPVDPDRERYQGEEVSPVKLVSAEPVSTFAVDVDTGAYANMRRFLNQGQMPPAAAVRTEELINYFRYDLPAPDRRAQPFSVSTDVTTTPWNASTRLMRVGLRGYDLPRASRPPANLVFLIDVSGSMNAVDKLPLVKSSLNMLTSSLTSRDRVSIVVYAGAAGMVLAPTANKEEIRSALNRLEAGGSTAGGAGLQLAYQVARGAMIDGGVNRVILATDGDFNVGVTSHDALIEMVERERDSGITLTTLGFGQGNYNEALMEQVADHGNGNYAYIDSATEAQKVLSDEMASTLFTIAKDVKIQVEFNPQFVSQYRLLGYENRALREEDFNNDRVDAGDIGAGHQVTAIYEIVPVGARGWTSPRRYENPQAGPEIARSEELAFVKLRYKLPNARESTLIERPVATSALRSARAPAGDMAFAVAVAAFAQKLRADPMMGDFKYADVRRLAGNPGNFWRQEFVKLVQIAEGQESL